MQSTAFVEQHRIAGEIERQMEERLKVARPGLIHLALTHGVSPDGAEDVVQETLTERTDPGDLNA